jgi:AcrR family transcriptional regulator
VPRITERRRQEQRLAISIAARTCFAERGFHATTMDQIITATGMSPNTVYRYFASKDAIIEAVCVETTTTVATRINAMADADTWPLPTPGDVLAVNVGSFVHPTTDAEGLASDEAQVAYLAISIWAELFTNSELRTPVEPALRDTLAAITRIAHRWQQHDLLKPGITPDLAARIVWRTALGVITEQVITPTTLASAAADLDLLVLAPPGTRHRNGPETNLEPQPREPRF